MASESISIVLFLEILDPVYIVPECEIILY